jgi:hypothetical protein
MNDNLGFQWYDAVGLIGVFIILASYLGLQAGKLAPDKLPYQFANIIGSVLVLVSLYFKPNVSSITIQIAWILISFYGIWRAYQKPKSSENP